MKKLTEIQNELKVPKGSYNSFGKYKYRSAEQILEAVKPLLKKHDCSLLITDNIETIGDKIYLRATAKFYFESEMIEVFGYAETSIHKGMSSEQCTGTASSYARKYALNGLFLIDETEADPDTKELVNITEKDIKDKLSKVNNQKDLVNLFNSLCEQDKSKFKSLFGNKKTELENE